MARFQHIGYPQIILHCTGRKFSISKAMGTSLRNRLNLRTYKNITIWYIDHHRCCQLSSTDNHCQLITLSAHLCVQQDRHHRTCNHYLSIMFCECMPCQLFYQTIHLLLHLLYLSVSQHSSLSAVHQPKGIISITLHCSQIPQMITTIRTSTPR